MKLVAAASNHPCSAHRASLDHFGGLGELGAKVVPSLITLVAWVSLVPRSYPPLITLVAWVSLVPSSYPPLSPWWPGELGAKVIPSLHHLGGLGELGAKVVPSLDHLGGLGELGAKVIPSLITLVAWVSLVPRSNPPLSPWWPG